MILIDALHINNGGGLVLLKYLISSLKKVSSDYYFLLDSRCDDLNLDIPENNCIFFESTLINRYKFYFTNKLNFSSVLCFGNLPPLTNMDCIVYTYFHQPMYLNIPREFSFQERLLFRVKMIFLNFYKLNSDYWLVQNTLIKNGLNQKYAIPKEKILLLPFYPNADLISLEIYRSRNTFIYVSNGEPHKNHYRLLDAFVFFYDEYKCGELVVTVSPEYLSICKKIKKLVDLGYPITNIGFVRRAELIKNYQRSEYLIFPSLEESFGLGIVEGIECGCKVIGADLPYMHQICKPSITFDAFDCDDIKNAFVKAIHKKEVYTEQLVFNQIDNLIETILK
jgi:glycosyltransferase involved in cell wall biosynthesis